MTSREAYVVLENVPQISTSLKSQTLRQAVPAMTFRASTVEQ